MKKIYYISLIIMLFLQPFKIANCTEIEKENINSISQDLIIKIGVDLENINSISQDIFISKGFHLIINLIENGVMIWVNGTLFYNSFTDYLKPITPTKLFGAGFKDSLPYVELYWSHDLIDFDFFEIQYSSDNEVWDYLGETIITEYMDNSVNNDTERYYRVKACRYIYDEWHNSTFSYIDFEKVYFITGNGAPSITPTINLNITTTGIIPTNIYNSTDGLDWDLLFSGNIDGEEIFGFIDYSKDYLFIRIYQEPLIGEANYLWVLIAILLGSMGYFVLKVRR